MNNTILVKRLTYGDGAPTKPSWLCIIYSKLGVRSRSK